MQNQNMQEYWVNVYQGDITPKHFKYHCYNLKQYAEFDGAITKSYGRAIYRIHVKMKPVDEILFNVMPKIYS